MPKLTALPDCDRVMRYVPWSKLRRDENDNVVGVNAEALQLRPDNATTSGYEDYLSVNWVEYFEKPGHQLRDCIWAMRKTRKAGSKSVFAVGNVGKIKQVCLSYGKKVRILHEPTDDKSHAAIRRLPPDDMTLLSALAEEAFVEMISNADIATEPD